jgi:hypothetical protein
VCGEDGAKEKHRESVCKLHCGGVQVRHPPSLLGWTIDAARLFAFSALADVDSQLQMEREFSFHLQLADVALGCKWKWKKCVIR